MDPKQVERTLQRYEEARTRIQALKYPTGGGKWAAFWEGHRARSRGQAEECCPYPDSPGAGGRISPLRRAWLAGWGAVTVT